MTDYRVEVKVKNNNILRMIEKAGYKTVGEFCRMNGLMTRVGLVGELVNMKRSPLDFRGKYLSIVHQICELLVCSPEDLFSEVQLTTALETNRRTIEVNEAEMRFALENKSQPMLLEEQLANDRLPDKIHDALETLTPREGKVIAMRFGLGEYGYAHTLGEVAEAFDCTRERIRQLEAKALRKLRHPRRSEELREYIE